MCKRQINQLSFTNEHGIIVADQVLNLRQGQLEMENFYCEECHGVIAESDFTPDASVHDLSIFCGYCDESALHFNC